MPHLRASPAEPGWGDCPWGNISFSLTQSSIALWFLLTNSFLPFGAVHPFKEREVWGLLGSVTTSICLKMGRHHLDSGKKKRELQILSLQGSTVIQTHTFHPRTSLAAPVLQVRFRSKASHLGTLMLDLKDPWEGISEWKQSGGVYGKVKMGTWGWTPLCLAAQSCPIICKPMNHHPPDSSVQGDSPGKNTGVGCHALLQGIFPTQGSNPSLLHCRQILYQLSHQGSPRLSSTSILLLIN